VLEHERAVVVDEVGEEKPEGALLEWREIGRDTDIVVMQSSTTRGMTMRGSGNRTSLSFLCEWQQRWELGVKGGKKKIRGDN